MHTNHQNVVIRVTDYSRGAVRWIQATTVTPGDSFNRITSAFASVVIDKEPWLWAGPRAARHALGVRAPAGPDLVQAMLAALGTLADEGHTVVILPSETNPGAEVRDKLTAEQHQLVHQLFGIAVQTAPAVRGVA
jgi:hypothetical protein